MAGAALTSLIVIADNARGSNQLPLILTVTLRWLASGADTARQWCAGTYTSSSHSEQEHRFRALFPQNPTGLYPAAPWCLLVDCRSSVAELGIDKLEDNSGQKPERLWFGNTNAEWQINSEAEPVPAWLLSDIDYDDSIEFVSADVTDLDVKRCHGSSVTSYALRRRV